MRRARKQSKIIGTRILAPGEVDDQIDLSQLYLAPTPDWTHDTLNLCHSIYLRYMVGQPCSVIPDRVFCDLPKWIFLEYLIDNCSVLLHGSNDPNISCLSPTILSGNLKGWNYPRYFAFTNSIEAIFHAILDRNRLKALNLPSTSVVTLPFGQPDNPAKRFYYGLDYRAISEAPWCKGTVYIYNRKDFADDFQSHPFYTQHPIKPIAKINISPADWPMLGRVHGVNGVEQMERHWDTFIGYPWTYDVDVHPLESKRCLAQAVRAQVESNFSEPIGLTSLGKLISESQFVTLRLFRAFLGRSPKEYQTELRIAKAKSLLQQGEAIGSVAAETGFYDQSHLNRHFRNIVGMTPAQYVRAQEYPIFKI